MGNRIYFLAAVLFLAALSLAFNAKAQQRINLTYPGWALSLDRQQLPLVQNDQEGESRTYALRLSSSTLLEHTGWRLPLSPSGYLSFEATFSTRHINPVHPGLTRPAFQAGLSLGLEF